MTPVIIAAFGDPGLIAARELFNIPIIGLGEAAMLSACLFGKKFSIISLLMLCLLGTRKALKS
jgi:Asp/Glu/hydantoin racemase